MFLIVDFQNYIYGMKYIIALLIAIPFGTIAQEKVENTNSTKMKKFELCLNLGYGNSTPLKIIRYSPYSYKYLATMYSSNSVYLKSNYTPVYAVKIGVRLSQRTSLGIRYNLQTVLYQYRQNVRPNSTFIYKNNDRYFGKPMSQLGIYGKYVQPIGKLSPYVVCQTSWVNAVVKPMYETEVYNAIGYGGALGVQYKISNKIVFNVQSDYTKMNFGKYYSMTQKSASMGVLFQF
jgi:hypothetical protein